MEFGGESFYFQHLENQEDTAMTCIEEMLSNEKGTLREYLLKLLLKEELITEPVYYKALELSNKEDRNNGFKK